MTRFEQNIGNKSVVIYCDAKLRNQAEGLLNALKEIHEQGGKLDDATKIQFGWTIFTLKKRAEEFVICEPDYYQNLLIGEKENITCSLTILAQQVALLKKLGLEGESSSFRDKILVAKNSLKERRIYLERKSIDDKSIWYVGLADGDHAAEQNEVYYSYQLVQERPSILQVLLLPSNYIVVFDDEEIEAILNDKDEIVFSDAGFVNFA